MCIIMYLKVRFFVKSFYVCVCVSPEVCRCAQCVSNKRMDRCYNILFLFGKLYSYLPVNELS